MSELKITGVETFITQPHGVRLVIVKVLTNQDGLYGLGCATFTQRHLAVKAALDRHVGPFVIGKAPQNIEDLWQSGMVNGYWRNGPVLNNAVSGIDMALWAVCRLPSAVCCLLPAACCLLLRRIWTGWPTSAACAPRP